MVVVHHDLETAAEYFDALILLKQRLYAFGAPEQVLNAELLSEVYEGKLRVFAALAGEPVDQVLEEARTAALQPGKRGADGS